MRTTILKAPLATVGHVACVIGLALTLIFRLETVSGQVPQLVNYTGRVAVGTVNFDGSGQFKFALVNSNGSTTYWSNDGTSTAGSQPTAAVTLTVIKGLYTVLLGDATLANMTAIPASVFTNADVRLRVWFNDGTNGSQLLTPDQRIAAVGYAMMAGNVPDGSITAAKLASNLTLGGATTGTFVASGDSDLQGNILKNPALGMLLLHPSYWQGAKREGTGGQADIIDQDGVIQINSNGSGSYSEVRGNDRIMRTPLDKPGTFISARAGFNSDPSAGKVFYIVAGNGGGFAPPGNGFGFKGIGTAL